MAVRAVALSNNQIWPALYYGVLESPMPLDGGSEDYDGPLEPDRVSVCTGCAPAVRGAGMSRSGAMANGLGASRYCYCCRVLL